MISEGFIEWMGVVFCVLIICLMSAALTADSWAKWCRKGERTIIGNDVYKCVMVEIK